MSHETMAHPENSTAAEEKGAAPAFSSVLRERTKAVHVEAERTGFIADLIRGRASRRGYAIFLRNLVPAYAALEADLEAYRTTPVVQTFADERLRRLPALTNDIAAIEGDDWMNLPLTLEAESYGAAVQAAARRDSLCLVAHAYARYLGDLSGGQILKPLLARNLGLEASAMSFYDFPIIPDIGSAKAAMRDALDEIPPGSDQAQDVAEEAVAAFRHNIAVSRAVQDLLT